ncbi:hypothetical protein ACIPSE_39295 [Streptomyces sp. NPDC090106]|uniref:hypothetical protein n=1 Tax=Streptomyces sp. NPDC090106 TaxID=3365946 RepID=UPI00380F3401
MNDFQAIADSVEVEAMRGEFTDAAMVRDRLRLAALFTLDGVLRMPDIPVEQVGREEILDGGEQLQSQWDFFVQPTYPGTPSWTVPPRQAARTSGNSSPRSTDARV